MPNAAPDPIVAICEEWVRLNATYDVRAAELGEAIEDAELPEWDRFNELQDAIETARPVTLSGLIAQQAVLRSIEPM